MGDLEICFVFVLFIFSTKLNNEGGKYSSSGFTECIQPERTKKNVAL